MPLHMEDKRMSKLIVISHPDILPQEPVLLTATLEAGADYLHLRKPCAKAEDIAHLLQEIPRKYHTKIVLHDAHCLAPDYGVGGIHLNGRNAQLLQGWQGRVSRSCHTLAEIEIYKKQYDYLLLSPIYNSISKPGYDTPFSTQQLTEAHNSGIIDSRVVAMGGITPENISSTMRHGFGGVAILGCLWNNLSIEHISDTIYNIKEQLSCYNS